MHVWLILSQASVAMLVRPYCVNTAAQETTAGEKHTAQTWRLMTKWLRQLFSISGVRRCKMHGTKLGHKFGMNAISGFTMLPIFGISRLSLNSLPEKIKALTQSSLPTLPFTFPPRSMTRSISPFLSLTRHRYPLAEPIKNTCTPWFPFPYGLHRAQAINRAQNRVADCRW